MTLGKGDFVAKLQRNWSDRNDDDFGKPLDPLQLTQGEMSHMWEVVELTYEEGGKKLTTVLKEVK